MSTTCMLRITKTTEIVVEVPVLPAFDNARSLAKLIGAGVFGRPPEDGFSNALVRLFQLIGQAVAEQSDFVRAQAPIGYDGELSVHGGVNLYQQLLNGIMRDWAAAEIEKRLAAHA